jgi:hypothetical protein
LRPPWVLQAAAMPIPLRGLRAPVPVLRLVLSSAAEPSQAPGGATMMEARNILNLNYTLWDKSV